MYSDNKLILQLMSLMKAFGIRKVVISPGSRHFPLVHSLKADSYFKLYSVVDERSAAFFALGLIQKDGNPVAVCCTSGTAAVNFSSAVSEAFYQYLPLVLLTADRIPEYLGQKEDQMISQANIFNEFIKYHVQLPLVKTEMDEWYANRLINEAFLELNSHGRGPVHVNYPVMNHHVDQFKTSKLPDARKINRHTAEMGEEEWIQVSKKLVGKNILIVWGQSVQITDMLLKVLDRFCESFKCVILTDRISNLNHPNAIKNSLSTLRALSTKDIATLRPDTVLSIGGNYIFNGEIKRFLKPFSGKFENWQLGLEDKVIDPFQQLTDIFEMKEQTFFSNINSLAEKKLLEDDYFMEWKSISTAIQEPEVEYSELYAIGRFLKFIPNDSILQIANSNPIRMAHLFEIHESVKCYCNRGVNGIDGCMSTAVGYASESDKLNFLVIGDLTFFYDMNSLWNRHLSNNLRILLLNNEGGAVMHSPFNAKIGKTLSTHTSAGHSTSAKGWVESLGIKYISAKNRNEVDEALRKLTASKSNGPILVEVFSNKEKDTQLLKDYYKTINRTRFTEKAIRKAKGTVAKMLKR